MSKDNTRSVEDFLKQYEKGVRTFDDIDLDGELHDLHLEGVSFHNCFITLKLNGCTLTNCRFDECNLKTSFFNHCSLIDVQILNCALDGVVINTSFLHHITSHNNYSQGFPLSVSDLVSTQSEKTISLKAFISTGVFGKVKLHMSKSEVTCFLGTPIDDQDFGTGFTGISYGAYELFFATDTDELYAIQNDHLLADCNNHGDQLFFENDKFDIDTWFLSPGKNWTLTEVSRLLEDEKIPFVINEQANPKTILLESSVALEFILQDNTFLLNAIRYFPLNG